MIALSYQGHPAVTKAAFVAEMEAHLAADRIRRGQYWTEGTGCAIGCGVQSIMNLKGIVGMAHSNHGLHAAALGIPKWLSEVQDMLFEGMRGPHQQSFPIEFARALPDGADLSGLHAAWMSWILREIDLPIAVGHAVAYVAIERVAAGIETNWATDNKFAASFAAKAITSSLTGGVDQAVRYATWAASRAVDVDARDALWATTDAVYAACGNAPYIAVWTKIADKLLTLMAACPVVAA